MRFEKEGMQPVNKFEDKSIQVAATSGDNAGMVPLKRFDDKSRKVREGKGDFEKSGRAPVIELLPSFKDVNEIGNALLLKYPANPLPFQSISVTRRESQIIPSQF